MQQEKSIMDKLNHGVANAQPRASKIDERIEYLDNLAKVLLS